MNPDFWIRVGAGLMFLAVALGAFAAHALKARLPIEMLTIFETGVRYHVYHALALILVGIGRGPSKTAWCFVGGMVLFSGSLYLLALTGVKRFGAITPIGGVLFLIGWALWAIRLRS